MINLIPAIISLIVISALLFGTHALRKQLTAMNDSVLMMQKVVDQQEKKLNEMTERLKKHSSEVEKAKSRPD